MKLQNGTDQQADLTVMAARVRDRDESAVAITAQLADRDSHVKVGRSVQIILGDSAGNGREGMVCIDFRQILSRFAER